MSVGFVNHNARFFNELSVIWREDRYLLFKLSLQLHFIQFWSLKIWSLKK
jgi:hypothetical protein